MSEKISRQFVASEIVTKYFNSELNEFIAKGSSSKSFGTIKTGGLKEFKYELFNIFKSLASELESWRTDFFNEYDVVSKEEIREALEPLFAIYEDGADYRILNKKHRNFLNRYFIDALKNFFKKMDQLYGLNYFLERASKINVNQDVVSDYAFAKQYFGKVSGFGVTVGKEEVEQLETIKEGTSKEKLEKEIEEFGKEAYVPEVSSVKEKKILVTFNIAVNKKKDQYTFILKRIQDNEIYKVNTFKTDMNGDFSTKIWKGNYIIELIGQAKLENNKKEIEISSQGKINVHFEPPTKTPIKESFNFLKKYKLALYGLIAVILVGLIFWQIYTIMTPSKDEIIFQQANEKCSVFVESFCPTKSVEVEGETFDCL